MGQKNGYQLMIRPAVGLRFARFAAGCAWLALMARAGRAIPNAPSIFASTEAATQAQLWRRVKDTPPCLKKLNSRYRYPWRTQKMRNGSQRVRRVRAFAAERDS
jgi:hypothetical protein